MDCRKALQTENLYAFMDGVTNEPGMEEVSEHFRVCPNCSSVVATEWRIREAVRHDRACVVVPKRLVAKAARILNDV